MPIKNVTTPCFCAGQCPKPTRPYHKYWLQTDHPEFPEYHSKVLFSFVFTGAGDICAWAPTENQLPSPSLESMSKRPAFVPPPDVGYHMRVELQEEDFERFEVFSLNVVWNEDDLPTTPGVLPSCDSIFVMLSEQLLGYEMVATPAPYLTCGPTEPEQTARVAQT